MEKSRSELPNCGKDLAGSFYSQFYPMKFRLTTISRHEITIESQLYTIYIPINMV